MPANNPYHKLALGFAELLKTGAALPLGMLPPLERPRAAAVAPKVLVFSPHPDDECIIGGLPLRLLRELKMTVINVAVTQGSDRKRQAERWRELKSACDYIGFDLLPTGENGLEQVDLNTREHQQQTWSFAVEIIAKIVSEQQPQIIFLPHDQDWNRTHIGTHYLLMDALAQMPPHFSCYVVETEYWGAMDTPNLMVESSAVDVGVLMAATSFHVGEVSRNPYHLRLPAWMIDNVRRGGELVCGQGQAVPDFTFATLYRLRRWGDGELQQVLKEGELCSIHEDVGRLFI